MVASLNRFENLICVSVLIIMNVCNGVGILPQGFISELEEDFEALRIMV